MQDFSIIALIASKDKYVRGMTLRNQPTLAGDQEWSAGVLIYHWPPMNYHRQEFRNVLSTVTRNVRSIIGTYRTEKVVLASRNFISRRLTLFIVENARVRSTKLLSQLRLQILPWSYKENTTRKIPKTVVIYSRYYFSINGCVFQSTVDFSAHLIYEERIIKHAPCGSP